MNKKSNNSIGQSWNVVYPIFMYFVVINIAMYVCTMIAVGLGADYEKQYMMIQTAAVAVTIPFIYRYYEKDQKEPTVCHQHLSELLAGKSMKLKIVNGILMAAVGAAAGISLNNIMTMTRLEELSEGYQEVTGYFFAGGVLFELLGACLLTPVLEEMLYRSVVYGRICDLMIHSAEEENPQRKARDKKSRWTAVVLTSLIFGLMHMNLIQFIYAALLGILLSWCVEQSGHFYGAVLAHMGANLMSVLRVETKVFAWMESGKTVFLASTAAFLILSILLIAVIKKWNN